VSHRIAATIVLYRPERAAVQALLASLAGDVERIFLYCNAAVPDDWAAGPVTLLGDGGNRGLGQAYNEAAAAARAAGCDRLILFDEDSRPPPGMAGRLARALDGAGGRVAVVAPRPVADGAVKLPAAAAGAAGLRERAFVISSGSLIDLAAFAEIGPFRADFFIDAIDIEWCFRARARGYRCLMAMEEAMPHRLGRGVLRLPGLGLSFVEQPPPRLYTYARNQMLMMRLPHVPLWWKARVAATLPLRLLADLAGGGRRAQRTALLRGIAAGLRGETGPPAL